MLITTYYSDLNNLPITGLVPHLTSYNFDTNAIVLNAVHMIETSSVNAPGWYEYDFVTSITTNTYTVNIDGGIALSAFVRYQVELIAPETVVSPFVEFGI